MILKNRQGVAIMMVMTTLALLTVLMAQFFYETSLNKLKIYNAQYRAQARLNAEAGLKFALAKLRLYKETRNMVEKDDNLKKMVDPSLLQQFIITPFIYPLPGGNSLDPIAKNELGNFTKNAILPGEFSVEIRSITGFLNPNNLRLVSKKIDPAEAELEKEVGKEKKEEFVLSNYIEKEMITTLTNLINDKKEEDEEFLAKYNDLSPELLVKELKYYVNNENSLINEDLGEVMTLYNNARIKPKFAALTSLSEMYQLAGWKDEITELILPQLTVHQIRSVSIPSMTNRDLRMIFPEMTKEQIKEFFLYRDGNEEQDPHPMKTVEDLQKAIVDNLVIMDKESFDKRITDLKKAGIRLGPSGQLFKVLSVGRYESATYSITAYIDLPSKPPPEKKKKATNINNPDDQPQVTDDKEENPPDDGGDKDKEPPLELLEPRIVEISTGTL